MDYRKEEKRFNKRRIIIGSCFLGVGTVFGIIALALNGWNFVDFITNPTTILIFLCTIAVGVFFLSNMEIK